MIAFAACINDRQDTTIYEIGTSSSISSSKSHIQRQPPIIDDCESSNNDDWRVFIVVDY
jgi:hypothetical protein